MIVLEIAIGLVLIYFLYSLLSSIIAEIFSSWIGMRARMLRQGIDNFLNDKTVGTPDDLKKWLQDIFLVEPGNFKYTTGGKFYEEPTIKYLAKPGEQTWYSLRNRKPSYISQENFVVTVLNMLSNRGRGISEWDKIKFSVETNALHLEPETLKMFQDMVKRSDDSFERFVSLIQNQFADSMDRLNGWYKRKIGTIIFYIGFIMCVIFNVDTFEIVHKLTNDKEKRVKMVELANNVVNQKSAIDSLMTRQDSIDEFKYKMEAHQMVKQSVLEANDIMALGWDFKIVPREEKICVSDDPGCLHCLDKDQAEKVKLLIDKDKKIRNQIKSLQFIIENDFPEDTKFLASNDIKMLFKEVFPAIDISSDNSVILDSIANISQRLNTKEIASIMEKQRTISKSEKIVHDSIILITGINFTQFDSISSEGHNRRVAGYGYPSFAGKAAVVLKAMSPKKSKLWGIIITALALTLGAQFWFDLLKKLISLRSAGVKPEETEEKRKQLEELKLKGNKITSKDPVEIAISENRGYWESLPGIVAINKAKEGLKVEIIAEEPEKLKNLIGNEVHSSYLIHPVEIEIIEGEKAKFLSSPRGYIYLDNPDERGSIAGVFHNKKTGKNCYLTCAHVVQRYEHGHFEYNKSEVKERENDTKIGDITNLIRSSFIDAAVIDFDERLIGEVYAVDLIKNIQSINDLTSDQLNKIKFRSAAYDEPVEGSLAMRSFSCKFDNDRFMYNLILIKHDGENRYSAGGDSGSLLYVSEKPNDNQSKIIPIGILIGSAIYNKKRYTLGVSLRETCDVLSVRQINS
jgi:hypothetical protein